MLRRSLIMQDENWEQVMKEMIYETTCICPICKQEIRKKSVRSSRNKLLNIDFDLNATYEKVNPLYYEITVCTICGYAQLNKNECEPTLAEAKLLTEQIAQKFSGKIYHEYYTIEDAIDIHKLALLNAVVRNALEGEKGYIALKTAWLYREKQDQEQERRFLQQALDCFLKAYRTENFPIFELEETVVIYLVAALSYQLEEYNQCSKWIDTALRHPDSSQKVKDRAFELKRMLKKKLEEIEQVKEA